MKKISRPIALRILLCLTFFLNGCLPLSRTVEKGSGQRVDASQFDFYNSRVEGGAIHRVMAYHKGLKHFFESDTDHKVFQKISENLVKFLDKRQFTAARLELPPETEKNATDETLEKSPAAVLYVKEVIEETLPELPSATSPSTFRSGGSRDLANARTPSIPIVACQTAQGKEEERSVMISLRGDTHYASNLIEGRSYFKVTPHATGFKSPSGHFQLLLPSSTPGLSSQGTLVEGNVSHNVICYQQSSPRT